MIETRIRLWPTAGVAAAALGLVSCGVEPDDEPQGGEARETGVQTPAAAPAASAGGEAGEAGAAIAYAGMSGDQLTALRIQHLRGFVMAAARLNAANLPTEAAVLVQQGLLEVYDVAPDQFGDLDIAVIRRATDSNLNRAQMMQRVRLSEAEMERAVRALNVDYAVLTVRMVDIATGLYQGVVQEDFVDAVEYQHSMGAALAARTALTQGQGELQRRNLRAYAEAQAELNRFVALWPDAAPPEQPAAYNQVLAQGSRVRLALSPLL